MNTRTGIAILLTIVAAGIYRIVVFQRLLARLEQSGRARVAEERSGRVRAWSHGVVPAQERRHAALGREWKVQGSDGVALDPTIVLPDNA